MLVVRHAAPARHKAAGVEASAQLYLNRGPQPMTLWRHIVIAVLPWQDLGPEIVGQQAARDHERLNGRPEIRPCGARSDGPGGGQRTPVVLPAATAPGSAADP
jgi:hypothetical protein